MDKRHGFTRRALTNHHLCREPFDPVFQFRPFKLYIITNEDGSLAISSEKDSGDVFLSPFNKNNKYSWVLIDSDTGAICFFYDLKSYFSIKLIDGTIPVTRNDILNNGTFTFNSDNTIVLKENPKYCLAYKPIQENKTEGINTGNVSIADTQNASMKKEGFFSFLFGSISEPFSELFNPLTEPVLEAVRLENVEKGQYLNKWKYVEIMDLRTLTDNADTIQELKTINDSSDAKIKALQRMIDNNKAICDIETTYRDDKITGYEQNWFIKTFLK